MPEAYRLGVVESPEGRAFRAWLTASITADGGLFVDLSDARWRAIEIGPDGWEVLDAHDLPFVRSPSMRPLTEPEGGWGVTVVTLTP